MQKLTQKFILISLFLFILGGTSWFVNNLWRENQQQKATEEQLIKQLQEAKEAKNEATITRRISSQLEEIAYQQKEISDIQKQKAEQQTRIADQMRINAEFEKERAVAAQQTALEAYAQMETQKEIAEAQKKEAVQAQLKADSLAHLALARSLGSQASTQFAAGYPDLARLLCYASWKFSAQNKENLYQPEIFNALSSTSEMSKQWNIHIGSIRDIICHSEAGKDYLVTASQYGEIALWQIHPSGNVTLKKEIIADSRYDFRRLQIDAERKGLIALSYSGQILYIDSLFHTTQIDLNLVAPIGIEYLSDAWIVACKSGEIFKISLTNGSSVLLYKHPHAITTFAKSRQEILLGDSQGGLFRLNPDGTTLELWKGIRQPITAIYKDQGIFALGYENGRIIIGNLEKGTMEELVGHLSRITCLQLVNKRLFTSSYDGTVRLWNLDKDNKVGSFVVAEQKNWIYVFRIENDRNLLITGNGKGELCISSISPEVMAETIREKLSRNFTKEEWNYYIGELSEYETFMQE